jgi:hypothetical protein
VFHSLVGGQELGSRVLPFLDDEVTVAAHAATNDTARAATSDEVKDLRHEASALKEAVPELENRMLKKV